MDYDENDFESREEFKRFQTEWALLNLIKELRGISHKGAMPTYFNAIKLGTQLIPEIFNDDSIIVKRHHEPELVRYYRQQAEATSKLEGKKVEPITLVEKRLEELDKLSGTDIEDKDLILKEQERLKKVRSLLLPRNVQEDYVLHHDIKCMKFGVKPVNIETKYTDYNISENRAIRVRMIHPNNGEQSMGADLIYEQYDPERRKVRFMMVQYKIWDGEILYWSEAKNMEPQIQKLNDNICAKGYCNCETGKNVSGEFRFPYCSAFLRPTDKLQTKDSAFTSSGMHIPVCKINGVTVLTGKGNKVLRKNNLKGTAISQKLFEDCFNYNQIGSRWLDYSELEKLYKDHKILEEDEHIIIHVQELEL